MQNHTYKGEELEIIRHLKRESMGKIWWDYVSYFFDYSTFYYKISCSCEIANSQNKLDEAIIGKLTKVNQPFQATKKMVLVCEGKKIEEIYIARTFLYFNTYSQYAKLNFFYNRAKRIVKNKSAPFIKTCTKPLVRHEEITCHPQSEEIKKVDPKYANLIDAGLLIQIDGKCLKAFVENNLFGFHIWYDNYFVDKDELKNISGRYEFIKI